MICRQLCLTFNVPLMNMGGAIKQDNNNMTIRNNNPENVLCCLKKTWRAECCEVKQNQYSACQTTALMLDLSTFVYMSGL